MMSGARETEMKGEINKSKSRSGWALEWQTAFITAIPSAYGPYFFMACRRPCRHKGSHARVAYGP